MRLPVLDRRRAGVLLHLGSLEGALGASGRAFIDWLAEAGFSLWQCLPLGPPGHGGSPYWVRSDFAGDPQLIDRNELPQHEEGAWRAFLQRTERWLDDYACFEALQRVHERRPWWQWPPELRDREPGAMARARSELAAEIEAVRREQFCFAWQWERLREHAHSRGVRLFGDLPFYVAPDSAETWSQREQFLLDATGRPKAVAGVPPDYFSGTGQLWGNPLYDWYRMRRDGFAYWRARLLTQLERFDLLRIDHFRALAAHWAIPAAAPDARGGLWRRTPGRALLRVVQTELGDLPLVAEDLGIITPDVDALREAFRLPGMRVLQFAFSGDARNPHLPYMLTRDCVVYTGTHDNDTTLGWYRSLEPAVREQVELFLGAGAAAMPEALVRAALASVGQLAVIPLQDVLGLDSSARLNTPATTTGNWSWRVPAGALGADLARHYARLNRAYGRA